MIIPLFRSTTADFRKWCRFVPLARDIVNMYKNNPLLIGRDNYDYARKICRQYKVLLASLDKDARRLFENTIMKHKAVRFSDKEERIAFGIIFDNWQEICFPGRNYQIKVITKEQIGERIKELRIRHGFTRTYVAEIIGINEATLKSYENGDRMLRFDVAYALAQVYGIELGELFGN